MNVNITLIHACIQFCLKPFKKKQININNITRHLNETKAFSVFKCLWWFFRLLSFIHPFTRRHIMLRSWRFIFNSKRNNIYVCLDKIENEWENQMILLDILFYIKVIFWRLRLAIDWILIFQITYGPTWRFLPWK